MDQVGDAKRLIASTKRRLKLNPTKREASVGLNTVDVHDFVANFLMLDATARASEKPEAREAPRAHRE